MRISVIGCGYLGTVHAAAMASLGHRVVGVDVDPRKIELLQTGAPPFHEPGLPQLLAEEVSSGRLTFSTDMSAVREAEVHFICVGTPQRAEGERADLSFVEAAVESLLPYLDESRLVIGKSTVPPGTAASLARRIAGSGAVLAWNPEFLREGFAVQDTIGPDRIVLGLPRGDRGQRASKLLREAYRGILETGIPLIETDYATAELVKLAANAFLATKISFINSMAEVAEAIGADVVQLADALGHDERIGRRFLGAGIGFGGGCLPKDIRSFAAEAERLGSAATAGLLRQVDAINLGRRDHAVRAIVSLLAPETSDVPTDGDALLSGLPLSGRTIAMLGVAFKPDSDDVRDSPGLDIASALQRLGAEVRVTDPAALENARRIAPELDYHESLEQAILGADLLFLATEWTQYRHELDPSWAMSLMRGDLVIDGRNCLEAKAWREAGWRYRGMGRR